MPRTFTTELEAITFLVRQDWVLLGIVWFQNNFSNLFQSPIDDKICVIQAGAIVTFIPAEPREKIEPDVRVIPSGQTPK